MHYDLNAGDYVEVEVSQASGGSLSVDPVEKYSLEFGMVKLPWHAKGEMLARR